MKHGKVFHTLRREVLAATPCSKARSICAIPLVGCCIYSYLPQGTELTCFAKDYVALKCHSRESC